MKPKTMTRNQTIRRHRLLWRWLAENPKAEKMDWPGWEWNEGKYEYTSGNCFLCACPSDGSGYCCPVVWPGGGTCMTSSSSYKKWCEAKSLKKRAALAKQIAELPVRRIRRKGNDTLESS